MAVKKGYGPFPGGNSSCNLAGVNARETWQALQAQLSNARAALEAGDQARALDEVNGALTIDPNFLAALSLRDRIIAAPPGVKSWPPARIKAPASHTVAAPHATSAFPAVEGYGGFEQRAKRRRVDRRLDAARLALETGRLKAAASALDEVIELDPNLPDLKALTAAFDDLRRSAARTHRGPRLAAAGVFVVMVLAASWLNESTPLLPRPMVAAAPLLPTPLPIVAVEPDEVAVAAAGKRDIVAEAVAPAVVPSVAEARVAVAEARVALAPVALARPPAEVAEVKPPMPPVTPAAPPAPPPSPSAPAPRVASAAPAPRIARAAPEAGLEAPVNVAAAVVPPAPAAEISADDSQLVKHTLQRYRNAYDGLDARKAQAVWPAVNQAALARAFDGLESQSLTFDACDVRVRGESATATCQGSARYVPKIGSREPRTEPRVWNFALQKAGGDWKIQTARAER